MAAGGIWVSSYRVKVLRHGNIVRQISLFGTASETPVNEAGIFFSEPNTGQLGDVNGSRVQINLPLSDFRDVYHILQTEKEIHFYYATPEGSTIVNYFHVGTGRDEPTGEGFVDQG